MWRRQLTKKDLLVPQNYTYDPRWDYLEFDPESKVGSCSIKGDRQGKLQDQEDVLSYQVVDGFNDLNNAIQKKVLRQTIHKINKDIEDISTAKIENSDAGSTLCTGIAWVDRQKKCVKTVCASLGDSLAYLCILRHKPTQTAVEVYLLNTLHAIPADAYSDEHPEYQRLINLNPEYRFKMRGKYLCLGNGLIPTRSLGDKDAYERYGLSHDPEILFKEFPITEKDQAFVIVASDGLALDQETIGRIVLENKHKSPEKIALALVSVLLQRGLDENWKRIDNTSVLAYLVQDKPVSATAFDGHGGSDWVARYASQQLYPRLLQAVKNPKDTLAKLPPISVVQSAIQGILNYQRWKRGELQESSRGPEGWLTFFRHFSSGLLTTESDYLLNLLIGRGLLKEQEKSVLACLKKFFEEGNYNNHSATQFILDEIRQVDHPSNPWKAIEFSEERIYSRDIVLQACRPK